MAQREQHRAGPYSRQNPGRKCRFCNDKVPAGRLTQHEKACCSSLKPVRRTEFWLGWDEKTSMPTQVLACGLNDECRTWMKYTTDKMTKVYEQHDGYVGVRPHHIGRQFACGGRPFDSRWYGPRGCSEECVDTGSIFVKKLLELPMVTTAKEMAAKCGIQIQDFLPERSGIKPDGNTVLFFGENYSPIMRDGPKDTSPLHTDQNWGLKLTILIKSNFLLNV